jgi:acetylglutamate kinase
MREQNPRLFWRSRNGNPVNPFYYAQSDGCMKHGSLGPGSEHAPLNRNGWKVFWYGLDGFDEIARCVAHCAERIPTLEDAA